MSRDYEYNRDIALYPGVYSFLGTPIDSRCRVHINNYSTVAFFSPQPPTLASSGTTLLSLLFFPEFLGTNVGVYPILLPSILTVRGGRGIRELETRGDADEKVTVATNAWRS